MKRAFTSLPVRVAGLFAVGSAPLTVLLLWQDGAYWALILSAWVLGGGIVLFGTRLMISGPLRQLGAAVDAWRGGGGFELPRAGLLPPELQLLALSFKRSARALGRREADLRVAIQRQELAMQEIHHRVKNNLQIVASLLNLQASRIRLPAARAEFQSARDRVRALATVHRHLYAHGDVHTINMRSFLTELCEQLFEAMGETVNGRIALEIEAPELEMSSDQAVPLSLIVTEAVTNAIKYAYPAGRTGRIAVRLTAEADTVDLRISVDGVGIPAGRVETESGTRDGIGIQLINGFARQLGAVLEIEEGNGTRYLVRMKLRRERLDSPALGPGRAGA